MMDKQPKLSDEELASIVLHEYLSMLGRPASVDELKAAIRILRENETAGKKLQ